MIRTRYVRTNGEVRNYAYGHLQRTAGQAIRTCREALLIGPLRCCGTQYLFDRRFFSSRTVNVLIALGEAVRDGDFVRAA